MAIPFAIAGTGIGLIGLIVITVAYAVYRNVKPRAAKEQQPVAS